MITEYGQKMRMVDAGVLRDAQQSRRWGEFQDLHELNTQIPTLSLVINMDGVALRKSSNVPFHPFQVSVLDLPPSVRESHILTPLMFMQTDLAKFEDKLLREFIEEVNDLSPNGLEWEAYGEVWKTFIIPFSIACDAPMKAKLMGIKGHTGYNSCPYE